MINFTLPVSVDVKNLLKSVNQGCTNTRTQYILHIANPFSVVLLEILLHTEQTTPVQ
jgi:hypothetical protein